LLLESVMVHCTTQPDLRVQRGSDVGFSSCTVPTYYYGDQVFHAGVWSSELEVSPEVISITK